MSDAKERPILFSAPMIRALLAGRKTQTRRLLDPLRHGLPSDDRGGWTYATGAGDWGGMSRKERGGTSSYPLPRCPYGVAGDRLWVRETWQYADWTEDGYPFIRYAADDARRLCDNIPAEWADRVNDTWATLSDSSNVAIDQRAADRKWRLGIFLPRWASRLTLEVTDVRVERLQSISEEDAKAEGAQRHDGHGVGHTGFVWPTARDSFARLWTRINGADS